MLSSRLKKIIKKSINLVLTPFILGDYFIFVKKKNNRFKISLSDMYPCVKDKTIKTGFDRHYIYHTGWASRILAKTNPEKHIDISSSLYFVSNASAFIPMEFYDYRPADLHLNNLICKKADLLGLPFADDSVISLSCMHTIEHVGLGRYGDIIDYDADLLAVKELKRVVKVNGNLLFVVPLGREAVIQFNAHRIYTYGLVKSYFSDWELKEFMYIPEKAGEPIYNPGDEFITKDKYGCGCFWFIKK